MNDQRGSRPRFQGYASPNYTPVPDELFDEQLAELSGAELKVLLYVIRRTFGFKRESDNISLSQMLNGLRARDGRVLDRGVGLSKKTLLLAIKSLEEQNIILTERRRSQEKGDEPTSYRLNVRVGTAREEITPPVGEKLHHGGGGETAPRPWGRNYATQETGEGKTGKYVSNFEGSHERVDKFGRDEEQGGEVPAVKPDLRTRDLTRHQVAGGPVGDEDEPGETRYVSLGEVIRLRQQAAAIGTGKAAAGADTPAQPVPSQPAAPASRRGGRPASGTVEERDKLYAFLKDFCPELGDEAQLASSITQVLKIFRRADLPVQRWDDPLYAARRITQEHSGSITKERSGASPGFRRKNKFPYFKAVLEQLVGLRPVPTGQPARAEPTG